MNRSTYENYPYLTKAEFTETCHYLDRKYCQATLGPLRRTWRLNVHSALDSASGGGPVPVTFLQIRRPLEDKSINEDLAGQIEGIGLKDDHGAGMTAADRRMTKLEESDKEALWKPRHRLRLDVPNVEYEIHLHPTYQVPCLWFSLHNLPADESPMDVETVYRRLVPGQYRDALRGSGAIAGISIDHHPLTGVPSFFIHPCLLGDAMAGFDCSKEDYLMVWLGLVGGCVGLWAPKEMAMPHGSSSLPNHS